MPDITVSALGLDYSGKKALDNVGFTARDGEFLTLLGPSGCGKTTTLMSIAGLARPTRGIITCGDDVLFDSTRSIDRPPERRNCGVVFQSYAIWPHKSVAENVAYPLQLRKVPKGEVRSRVHEALSMVGLEGLADRYPYQLSGGQQQRVALARAVTYSPGVLLLDEPLSNLDAKLREQARNWLKEFQSAVGLTTIFVTHDQDEALALSDRIIVMNDGRIEQAGAPEEIYHKPATPFVASFLGSANLLPGTVCGKSGGLTQVRLSGNGAALSVQDSGQHGAVTVMARPEDIEIGTENQDAARFPVQGRVTSRMFVGAAFRYVVQCGEHEIAVTARERWEIGPVRLRFHPELCRLFPAGETDSAANTSEHPDHVREATHA
ncbi:ABC transporter ATP-binding protein [Rhodococcus rhodochrous]|uniref:ABC-type quaternary amine transporter n=1 Tax=Rhodococcus rhodochrous KG-21 TaxID=1441923 RepID=A0A0M8PCT2_RHORH|nr:ABC transporter ATP-binding protein [Rhodococcus rhodochrous]KOS53776.1 ABC transporter ATP-binding protein [Rhodococcus rhodochrous KG-21]